MLDTNVLISALIFGGQAGRLLSKLFLSEHELLVSEYDDEEFQAKLQQKWPAKAEKVYQCYRTLNINFCKSTDKVLGHLRDEKDIPVLSDAIYNKVDIILTGDKDFLEANLTNPLVFSPSMLYEYLNKEWRNEVYCIESKYSMPFVLINNWETGVISCLLFYWKNLEEKMIEDIYKNIVYSSEYM